MGTVNISIGRKLNKGSTDGPQAMRILSSENLATSTTSAQGVNAAPAGTFDAYDLVVRIVPIDEPMYVNVGANPIAAVGSLYVFTGAELFLSIAPGHKIAVRDAA